MELEKASRIKTGFPFTFSTLSSYSRLVSILFRFELLSKRVEIPFRINSGSVRRSRHLVDLATL